MATTKAAKKKTATKTPPKKKATAKKKVTKATTKKATTKKPAKKCCPHDRHGKPIDLFNGEKFPAILLKSIEVIERPKRGQKKVFFNPRQPESFDPVKMASLLRSIRIDELLEPITVNVISKNGRSVDAVQLIAGERRFRSLIKLVDANLPCYDPMLVAPVKYRANSVVIHGDRFAQVLSHTKAGVEIQYFDLNEKPTTEKATVAHGDLHPTDSAKKVYATVPCKVKYNLTETTMMHLAVTENKESEPLTTLEEILACERLSEMECKQEEISYMLANNVTWVSQTLSFRTQLPKECFETLCRGDMKRNVAVKFLEYDLAERQKLFDSTVKAEIKDTEEKIAKHQADQDQHADEADMHNADAKTAENKGDETGAKRSRRKAASSGKKAEQAGTRRDRAEGESGNIRQGHVQKGAADAGVSPRKAKMLARPEVEELYVKQMEGLLDGETEDPICGEVIPAYAVDLVRKTAQAVLAGERDPMRVIRSHMVEQEEWDVPDGGDTDDEYVPSDDDLGDAEDAFGELDDERDIEQELADMGVEED